MGNDNGKKDIPRFWATIDSHIRGLATVFGAIVVLLGALWGLWSWVSDHLEPKKPSTSQTGAPPLPVSQEPDEGHSSPAPSLLAPASVAAASPDVNSSQAVAATAHVASVASFGTSAANGASEVAASGVRSASKSVSPETHSSVGGRFVVVVGVGSDRKVAEQIVEEVKAAGVPSFIETNVNADPSRRYQVRLGPFPDRYAAEAAIRRIREAGLTHDEGSPQ